MKEEVAGRTLLDLVPEDTPSVVLGEMADGRRVLVAGGLRPSGAPTKGDYMHRPILATLLGVAPAGADPAPLLTAAAAALDRSLADTLPVAWTDGGPAVTPGPWAPRPTGWTAGRAPDLSESVAVPEHDRGTLVRELAAVRPEHLDRLSPDRPLLLATDMVDREDLDALRPWRAVSDTVTHRTPLGLKEGDHPGFPRWVILAGVAVGGLAVLAWIVVTRILGRG
jgi:hypothetical protein